ncbi:hypothetical protein Tco_1040802 [Tanacetum coccineum]|uniref:RWP-RK domain-containing protein n=1 Tax=Tanacetum coccineum TaxID=301880 RepID=A0ABQ5GGS1_9ASTR
MKTRRSAFKARNVEEIRRRKHPMGTHETWPYFGLTLEEASHAVGASERTLRRRIREDGYVAWPVPTQKAINQERPLPAIYATN